MSAPNDKTVMRWISLDFAPSPKATVDANGFLKAPATIARAGNVQSYSLTDGSMRREYRPADEVAKSVSSFEQLPVTVGHPARLLTPDDAKRHAVGSLANVRLEGDRVMADVCLVDAAAIAMVQDGKTALSCGYATTLQLQPGRSPNGDAYDAVQTDIAGNHLAIVDRARAPGAQLHLDEGDAVATNIDEGKETVMIKIGDKEYTDSATAQAAADAEIADRVQKRVALVEKARAVLGDVKIDAIADATLEAMIKGAELVKKAQPAPMQPAPVHKASATDSVRAGVAKPAIPRTEGRGRPRTDVQARFYCDAQVLAGAELARTGITEKSIGLQPYLTQLRAKTEQVVGALSAYRNDGVSIEDYRRRADEARRNCDAQTLAGNVKARVRR